MPPEFCKSTVWLYPNDIWEARIQGIPSLREPYAPLREGMAMKRFIQIVLTGLASLALCLAAGCMIIPMPEHGILAGRGKIDAAERNSISTGATSREDVLLRFGEPDAVIDDERIFVYYWVVSIGKFMIGGGYGPATVDEIPKYYLFTLEFDEKGRLKRAGVESDWSIWWTAARVLDNLNKRIQDGGKPFELTESKASVLRPDKVH
jgi:hypothetical protein